jgi:predicted porin
VTISGNVDLGIQTTKESGYTVYDTAASGANIAVPDGTKISQKKNSPIGNGAQGWTSSALGLDIKEDLGGGMTAGYSTAIDMFSWAPANDAAAGTASVLQNSRHSYIFLGDAKMGEVRLGYQYSLDDQIQGGIGRATPTGNIAGRVQNAKLSVNPAAAAFKPSVTTATSAVYTQEAQQMQDFISTGALTRVNAIQYASPVVNGLQGLVQYGTTAKDQSRDTATVGGKADTKLQGLAVKYNAGKLNLGASSMKNVTEADALGTDTTKAYKITEKYMDLAANYDFGVATAYYNYFSRKVNIAAGANWNPATAYPANGAAFVGNSTTNLPTPYGAMDDGAHTKTTGYDLGAKVPMGKFTLFATTGKAKGTGAGNATDADTSVTFKGRTLGATYDLSKRTSFNAYYGTVKATGDTDGFELKKTQTGFGLRHTF